MKLRGGKKESEELKMYVTLGSYSRNKASQEE